MSLKVNQGWEYIWKHNLSNFSYHKKKNLIAAKIFNMYYASRYFEKKEDTKIENIRPD